MEGIEVLRVFHFLGSRRGQWGRAVAEGSFAFAAAAALMEATPDAVIVESPSLLSCWTGVLLQRMRGSAFVMHVSDLIPDMVMALGMLRPGFLSRTLSKMAHFFYREADAVVAVTKGIQNSLMQKGIENGKIILIVNGVEECWLANGMSEQEARDSFRLIYFGNHGMAQNLEVVLETAGILQDEKVLFDLYGDGIEKTRLVQKARARELRNVVFHPSISQPELIKKLRQANAVLVPLADRPEMEEAIPSKLIEAMAVGRPVILSARGEPAELVQRVGAGIAVEPENPQALAEAFRYLREHPEEARQMGDRGREYVRQTRLRSNLVDQLEKMLLELVERKHKVS
jgi:glycosyltransferase involved in cell wall biosynthesis